MQKITLNLDYINYLGLNCQSFANICISICIYVYVCVYLCLLVFSFNLYICMRVCMCVNVAKF